MRHFIALQCLFMLSVSTVSGKWLSTYIFITVTRKIKHSDLGGLLNIRPADNFTFFINSPQSMLGSTGPSPSLYQFHLERTLLITFESLCSDSISQKCEHLTPPRWLHNQLQLKGNRLKIKDRALSVLSPILWNKHYLFNTSMISSSFQKAFKDPPIQSGLCITCITCSFHLFYMYQKLIIICIIFSSTSSRSNSSLPICITSQRSPVQTQEETQKIRKGTCCKIMPNETCRTAHYSGSKQVREQQKLAAFLLLVILLKDAPVIRQPMKSFDWRTLSVLV